MSIEKFLWIPALAVMGWLIGNMTYESHIRMQCEIHGYRLAEGDWFTEQFYCTKLNDKSEWIYTPHKQAMKEQKQ